mmetsp:Transcript_8055/g.19636  ORF Transcript_8055/g.19636 Transcript_8055/m.19636 type:complete len:226 (+) Transcript_8055:1017-1694(+)
MARGRRRRRQLGPATSRAVQRDLVCRGGTGQITGHALCSAHDGQRRGQGGGPPCHGCGNGVVRDSSRGHQRLLLPRHLQPAVVVPSRERLRAQCLVVLGGSQAGAPGERGVRVSGRDGDPRLHPRQWQDHPARHWHGARVPAQPVQHGRARGPPARRLLKECLGPGVLPRHLHVARVRLLRQRRGCARQVHAHARGPSGGPRAGRAHLCSALRWCRGLPHHVSPD